MSRVTDVLDDVVNAINGASLSQTVTATRKNIYNLNREENHSLSLVVYPRTRTAELLTRNDVLEIHLVDIIIRKPVDISGTSTTAVDDLITFTDDIAELLFPSRLSSTSKWVTGLSQEEYFDTAALHENGLFLSTMTLTIRDKF